VPGVQRVQFFPLVSVHYIDDITAKDRRGPWMRVAADRYRFLRRIQQTAIILDPILSPEHRLLVIARNLQLADNHIIA